MVLITGVIKNTDGTPYIGSVKFALNDLGIESNTVYLPTVVTVDSDGTFTVDLWPNTNSLTSSYYKCSLDNGSVFNISIPGNNPSYNLGDVILIDPETLDPGIIWRLNQIESGIATRVSDSDARLSDAREWVAQTAPIEVVSQPTNNTRYAWTPQRIWDTIVSWFSGITSDDIQEGSNNLYYTDSRVANNLAVQANTNKVSSTGSVTTHSDITSAGSGQIITTPERTKLSNIEDNAQVNTVDSVVGKTGAIVLNSSDVGLGNVPNIDTTNADNITSGALSGSRLSYGTVANTPAQGNDARFTNSREWTASTVSQSVAQAGTDTTRYAWTSQRVRDNVSFYTQPYTSAEKSKLAGLNSADYLPAEGTAVNSQLWDGWPRNTYLNQAVTTTSTPTFNGIRIYDDSNLDPSGNIKVGRDSDQYITFTGGPQGNVITSVSKDTNPKPLYINIKKGGNYSNYVFDDNTLTTPGDINASGLEITGVAPTIHFEDIDHRSFWLHNNSNRFYILSDNDDDGVWESPYPAYWDDISQKSYFWGNEVAVHNTTPKFSGIEIYSGTTKMGDIGVLDTTWLCINQATAKNIYTPRIIRADGGFQVYAKQVVSADGNTLYENSVALATKYIRKDTEDTINVHTRWADNKELRLGAQADGRIFHSGENFHFHNYTGQLRIESGSINLFSRGSGVNSIVYLQGYPATKMFGLNTYSDNFLYIQQFTAANQYFEGNIIRFSRTEMRHYVPLVNGSSRHIKDIKGSIPDGLDLVNRLNPVVYNYKGQDNTEVGLIAEEVPPESHLVYGSGPDMAIDYTKLPIYMIDAIQQLTKRIEALEENAKKQ